MDDSYALDRHVSASIKGLLLRRFSWPQAWATIQNMWRWGALDSREPAPLWKGQTLKVEWLKGGRCWIDPESLQIVRLEDKAINIPPDFPITRSDGATDYDLADIGGRKYWLPVRAEVLLVEGGAKLHTRNVIEFKRYRKFEAEVRIVPD